MNARASALVTILCAASTLTACGSGAAMTAPATQVPSSSLASPWPSPTHPAAQSPAPATPFEPSPSQLSAPSPSPSQQATYVPAPQPSLAPLSASAPAMPTGARLDYLSNPCKSMNQDETCQWLHAAWQETNPSGVTIRIYAVTACLHTPTADNPSEHCVVDGDVLPGASLVLLGTAPASTGSFSFMLTVGAPGRIGWLPGGGPAVFAVVLQAVDGYGGSAFAIAGSSAGCYGCWQ